MNKIKRIGSTNLLLMLCFKVILVLSACNQPDVNDGNSAPAAPSMSIVEPPVFSLPSWIYTMPQTVIISSKTVGVKIKYTTDGSDPKTSLTALTGTTVNVMKSMTIRAFASKKDWQDSETASIDYIITGRTATPAFSLPAGTYTTDQTVMIDCATDGAVIEYTTDGTDPQTSGTAQIGTIVTVTKSLTLKAYAYKANWQDSKTASAEYEIIKSNSIPRTGLAAEYLFNRNANDSSGYNNHGIVINAEATTDRFGNTNSAYSFNGTSSWIYIGDPVPPSLQIQNEITLAAWIYVTKYPAGDTLGCIVGSQYDPTSSGTTLFIDGRTLSQSPAGSICFQIGNGSFHYENTNSKVQQNKWIFITATWKANEDAKVYYNGVLQSLTCLSWTGLITYTDSRFMIGTQNKDFNNRYFNGIIDDVRIYNRALSEAEVLVLYHETP